MAKTKSCIVMLNENVQKLSGFCMLLFTDVKGGIVILHIIDAHVKKNYYACTCFNIPNEHVSESARKKCLQITTESFKLTSVYELHGDYDRRVLVLEQQLT